MASRRLLLNREHRQDSSPGSRVARSRLTEALERRFAPSSKECGEVVAIFSGRGPQHDAEQARLSQIVDVINERFGLDLDDTDQLLFDQFEESWAADATLLARARTNDYDNFLLVFDQTFVDTIVKRVDSNEEMFKKILDEPDFRQTVLEFYAGKLYARLRHPTTSSGSRLSNRRCARFGPGPTPLRVRVRSFARRLQVSASRLLTRPHRPLSGS